MLNTFYTFSINFLLHKINTNDATIFIAYLIQTENKKVDYTPA